MDYKENFINILVLSHYWRSSLDRSIQYTIVVNYKKTGSAVVLAEQIRPYKSYLYNFGKN